MDGRTGDKAARNILDRLGRVEGQVRGIQNMVRERRDCEKVLAQVKAARQALAAVASLVVRNHMSHCLNREGTPEEAAERLEKAMDIVSRYVRD